MSADLLRRAAAKLREHANAAIPGPWVKDGGEIYNTGPGGIWVGETLHSGDEVTTEANSAFIVTMHPPVALALADWLDLQAQSEDGRVTQERRMLLADGALLTHRDEMALIVARAVLREPADGTS